MSIDGVWIKPTAEQAKWFNEGVDTAKEILRQQEAGLAAVTAERDALLKDKARLDWLDSNPLFPYLDFVYASGPMNGATPHGGWRTHIDAAMRGEGES